VHVKIAPNLVKNLYMDKSSAFVAVLAIFLAAIFVSLAVGIGNQTQIYDAPPQQLWDTR